MTQLINIIPFLSNNAAGITILLSVVAGVFKFWQFVSIKKEEERKINFEKYHQLIESFNTNYKQSDGRPFIESQAAIVYELRNFPAYYSITKKILDKRILQFDKREEEFKDANLMLISEMEDTSKFISRKIFFDFFHKGN